MGFEALAREAWYSHAPGMAASLLSLLLLPVSYLYGAWMNHRRKQHLAYPALAEKFDLPVIAIDNLTLGGSAKTPVTMYIAKLLAQMGRKPVVISRGYRGSMEGKVALVSDGNEILLSAAQAGDEAVMMARGLPGIPVVIGAKRIEAVGFAKEKLDIDSVVLDDSFQHIAIHRDLNILCVNGALGFGNGRVFPSGPLREPIRAARQADLCLVTSYGNVREGIEETLRQGGFTGQCLKVSFEAGKLIAIDGAELQVADIKGKKVAAFSAIANPEAFFDVCTGLGADLSETVSFGDHHEYKASDFQRLDRLAKEGAFEYYVTTAKDAVKLAELGHDFPVPVVAAYMEPLMDSEDQKQLMNTLKGVM